MKRLLWLPFLLAFFAWADEPADRAAIDRVIAGLNEHHQRTGLFTADAGDSAEVFDALWKGKRLAYRAKPSSGSPTVAISHEPWGEAAIQWPGASVEIVNPRIVSRGVRFIASDVALADSACVYRQRDTTTETPLLIVLKREGNDWRIAAIRALAPR